MVDWKCDFGGNFKRPELFSKTGGKTFARASRGFAEEDLMSSLLGVDTVCM
jgi:hypothetical protein